MNLAGSGHDRAGLDLVRSMANTADAPMFALATAFDEHALEAYDLGVVDYLVRKPFTEERVSQCLQRLSTRRPVERRPQPTPRIVARRKKSLVFLEPGRDLGLRAAADRMTFVHTPHGRLDLDLSLAAIESSLGRTLTRVHRNWLVNVAQIRELQRDGIRHPAPRRSSPRRRDAGDPRGVLVPVSRDRSQAIRETLLANATGLRRS